MSLDGKCWYISDLTNRWISEKMDGVRAFWNGRLIYINGNLITCPQWFTQKLTIDIQLDGELWMGRHNTHTNVTAVLSSKTADWNQISYYIFDIPSSLGKTYEERIEEMELLKP